MAYCRATHRIEHTRPAASMSKTCDALQKLYFNLFNDERVIKSTWKITMLHAVMVQLCNCFNLTISNMCNVHKNCWSQKGQLNEVNCWHRLSLSICLTSHLYFKATSNYIKYKLDGSVHHFSRTMFHIQLKMKPWIWLYSEMYTIIINGYFAYR